MTALLALLLLPTQAGAVDSAADAPKVSTRIYLSADKLVAGSEVPFAVKVTISEGWHVNAQPPSQEYLIPVEVKVTSKTGVTLTDVLYPRGAMHTTAVGNISVYEGEVYVFGTLTVPAAAAGQTDSLIFETAYQSCSDDNQCLPPTTSRITGRIAVVPAGTTVKPMNAQVFARRGTMLQTGTLIKPAATK